MTHLATALVFYGAALVIFCACGAAAERWLMRRDSRRNSDQRVHDNLHRAGLL